VRRWNEAVLGDRWDGVSQETVHTTDELVRIAGALRARDRSAREVADGRGGKAAPIRLSPR
jgi:hypothetical protein